MGTIINSFRGDKATNIIHEEIKQIANNYPFRDKTKMTLSNSYLLSIQFSLIPIIFLIIKNYQTDF